MQNPKQRPKKDLAWQPN